MSVTQFSKTIEHIEDLILTGMGVPLTPWTLVNGEKLVPLLDTVRENLPDEIQSAHRILQSRDVLIQEAQQKANEIVQVAKRQAEHMLSESELMRAVQAEAEHLRQSLMADLEAERRKAVEEISVMKWQAEQDTLQMRGSAEQYAETILGSLQGNIREFQTILTQGQNHLKQVRMERTNAERVAQLQRDTTVHRQPVAGRHAPARAATPSPVSAPPAPVAMSAPMTAATPDTLPLVTPPAYWQPEHTPAAMHSQAPSGYNPTVGVHSYGGHAGAPTVGNPQDVENFLKQTTVTTPH